jgi:cyclin-dependent kinase 7
MALSGAFGTVQLTNGQAIKQFSDTSMDAPFLREVCALKAMKHTNIATIISAHSSSDLQRIVMPQFEGTLRCYQDNPTTSLQLRAIARQLCHALSYLHLSGWMHRDIKPANVLIRRADAKKPHVVLNDFNTCIKYIPGRQNTICPTTHWYAPLEMLLGVKQYTQAVDLWSLGMTLLDIRTGRFNISTGAVSPFKYHILASKQFAAFGVPTENDWPGVTLLPDYYAVYRSRRDGYASIDLSTMDDHEIFTSMLQLNPLRRHFPIAQKNDSAQSAATTQLAGWNGDITLTMRDILIEWLVEVSNAWKFHRQTTYQAVQIVDSHLTQVPMARTRTQIQLIGISALYITHCLHEVVEHDRDQFVYLTDNAYTRAQLDDCYDMILSANDFNCYIPVAQSIVEQVNKVWGNAGNKSDSNKLKTTLDYECNMCNVTHR